MKTKLKTLYTCIAVFALLVVRISEAVPPGGPAVKKKKQPEEFVPPSKPDYSQLERVPASTIASHPEFIAACKSMAGYYKDPARNPALKKTLFISGINYSYRDFFHNFHCFTDRLGIRFLPISMDQQIYNYLTTNNISPTFLMPDVPGRGKVNSDASGFGGKNFNLIGCRKIEAVAGALALGYDVVFSDVDIALLKDPIDHLFFPDVDYVHSVNIPCGSRFGWRFNHTMEGNTGFYSVKSNPRTIRTWDLTYRACSLTPLYDDQTMFWLILRSNLDPIANPLPSCPSSNTPPSTSSLSPLPSSSLSSSWSLSIPQVNNSVVSCPLDSCVFSAGCLRSGETFHNLKHALGGREAVMAHANWMNGRDKKKNALSGYGLWLAQWQPNANPDPRPLAQSNPNPNPNLVALRPHNPLSLSLSNPKGELLNGNAPRRVFFEPARPIGGPLQLRDGITGGDLSSISNSNNNNPNALAAGNVRDRSSKRLQRLRKVSLRERERGAGKAPRAAAGDPDLDLGRSRRRLEGSEALARGEWTCRAIASPLVKKPQAQAQAQGWS